MGTMKEILKEIQMSKKQDIVFEMILKSLKRKKPGKYRLQTEEEWVKKPQEWISDDLVYNLWAPRLRLSVGQDHHEITGEVPLAW